MNFTVINVDQRSPEWFAARLGRLTGSKAGDMMATLKGGGEAAGRRNLRLQLVLERLTNKVQESDFQSEAMRIGIEREADGYRAYEAHTGEICTRTGFLQHNTVMAGMSLDGHVGDYEGIFDVKCPQPAAHYEFLRSEKIPGAYRWQLLHGLWLTGAKWADLASYQPDFPAGLDFKVVRLERDEAEIDAYSLAVSLFLSEVENEVENVKGLMEVGSAV